MTLRELANPVLLLAVGLKRRIREGSPIDFQQVHSQAIGTFNQTDQLAATKGLTDRWQRAKRALVYLLDEIATTDRWSGQSQWRTEALELRLLSVPTSQRGRDFYEEEYKFAVDTNDIDYMEILFYSMALGFEGMYARQPAQLQNHLDNLYGRLPKAFLDPNERMFGDAYYVDETKNDPKAPMKLTTVLAMFIGLFVTFFVVNFFFYKDTVGKLDQLAIDVVKHPVESPAAAVDAAPQ